MKEKISVSKMSYKGKLKYKTIIKVINGSINKYKASIIIVCSIRRVNQLIDIYKTEGKNEVIHKYKNSIPINKFNSSFREKIVNLYKDLIFIIKQHEKFSILEK